MATYAFADDNDRVALIWPEPEEYTIDQCFHPEFIAKRTKRLTDKQAETVKEGWVFSTLTEPPPVIVPDPSQEELYDAAKRIRDVIRDGGMVVNGISVDTNVIGYALVRGALDYVKETPGTTVDFSLGGGKTTTLGEAELSAIYSALSQHVQGCFTAYAEACRGIEDNSIKTVDDIRSKISWPANA